MTSDEQRQPPEPARSRVRSGATWAAVGVLAAALLAGSQASRWYETRLASERRADVERRLVPYGNALTTAVNRRLALLKGLAALAQARPSEAALRQDFDRFAAALGTGMPGLRALEVFPPRAPVLVYPTEGNEQTLGRTLQALINDERPYVRVDMQRTIRTRAIALSRPYELRQGGRGLVARLAVYDGDALWGIAVIVLDLPPLLTEAGLVPSPQGLLVSLRTQSGEVFDGSPGVFGSDPVTYRIALPEGAWEMAAIPAGGWAASYAGALRLLQAIGLILIGTVAILVYTLVDQQSRLRWAVRERTRALEQSETRYRQLFDSNSDALFVVDSTGRILDVNQVVLDTYGYTRQELAGMGARDLAPPAAAGEVSDRLRQAWSGPTRFRWAHRRKDGTEFPIEVHTNRVVLNGQPCILADVRDLSEVQRAEAAVSRLAGELRQAQKMEAVGRLAGGVAHDFNNMLSVILGHVELALDALPAADPMAASLREIQDAAEHSADLTRQLLAFARRQTITPKELDLNAAVERALKMLRPLIGENLDVRWRPAMGLWPVYMDEAQVDQVLANLVVNARDAITDVGRITIETGMIALDDASSELHGGMLPGSYVVLTVSDNGCGMDVETRSKIFEPFFTTKPVGQGTGLGLATVYGIVKQNQGFVNVYSEPGLGTSFKIYIPRSESEAKAEAEANDAPPPPMGHETVLLVEDEGALLRLGTRFLEQLGYTVLAAAGPMQALDLAGRYDGPIHLLMTDVIMPGMNGRDLRQQIALKRPAIRCLYLSGYTADVIAHHGVLDPDVHFLAKPYSFGELATTLRTVLGAGGGPRWDPDGDQPLLPLGVE